MPSTPVLTLEKAHEIAVKAGIKFVYIGNVFGTEYEDTYCPKCKKIIIERKGYSVSTGNLTNGVCKFCGEKISGVF